MLFSDQKNIDNFLDNIFKRSSFSKFIKLNEIDYYSLNKKNAQCHFPNCTEKAIGSHTYPKSYLKKLASGGKVYSSDIKHIVANAFEPSGFETVRESNINQSGVQPLFCLEHDTKVFRCIEVPAHNTDLETFLYLFLYRAFIYDFQLESEIHEPTELRKLNTDKDYSKKITEHEFIKFSLGQRIVDSIVGQKNDFNSYKILKSKFDRVFNLNETPSYNDFNKYFSLKFYDLGFVPEFWASGTMYFISRESIEMHDGVPLQSIFAIVPDKTLNTAYFAILSPHEALPAIKPLIDSLDNYYNSREKHQQEMFTKMMEFLLLDASQNIIMTDNLVTKLKKSGSIVNLSKITYALTLNRLGMNIFDHEATRLYAFELSKTLDLIYNKEYE